MDLADLFIQGFLLEEFDKKPLGLQEQELQALQARYALLNQRYQKNVGKTGGAPTKWPDDLLKSIINQVDFISKTAEYKKRKHSLERDDEPGITAYVMLLEQLYEKPEMKRMMADFQIDASTVKKWQKEHKETAKGIKVRVDSYKKRKQTGI